MSVEVYGGGGGASPKLQSKIVTPSTAQQIVTPDNGMDGLSKVTVNAMPGGTLAAPTISAGGLITSKIEKGGYLNAGDNRTLQLQTRGGRTVVPTTYNQTAVPSGVYTTGGIDVQGDSNLIPSNIRSGASIFGVAGTYQGDATLFTPTWGTVTSGIVSISIPRTARYAAFDVVFGGYWEGLEYVGTYQNGALVMGNPNGVFNYLFTQYDSYITVDLSDNYSSFSATPASQQGFGII